MLVRFPTQKMRVFNGREGTSLLLLTRNLSDQVHEPNLSSLLPFSFCSIIHACRLTCLFPLTRTIMYERRPPRLIYGKKTDVDTPAFPSVPYMRTGVSRWMRMRRKGGG